MPARSILRNLVLGVGASCLVGPALADITWTFNVSSTGTKAADITNAQTEINHTPQGNGGTPDNSITPNTSTNTSGSWGNTVTATGSQNGQTVTATSQAWSNTGNTTLGNNATNTTTTGQASATTALETAYLGLYTGGIGVNNRDGLGSGANTGDNTGNGSTTSPDTYSNAPEHAIDNNGRYDSVLFSFNTAVDVNSFTIGYPPSGGLDSDMLVLAYTGSGTPITSGTSTYASMLTNGWTAIGGTTVNGAPNVYSNVANNTNQTAVVNCTLSNCFYQYWLIGTYIPLWNGGAQPDSSSDFAKILSVTGAPKQGKVPEPGSLLLAGAALGMGTIVRRMRKRIAGAS